MSRQPKEENYHLYWNLDSMVNLIDTSHVYEESKEFIENGDFGSRKVHLFQFLKFGKNGTAFISDFSKDSFNSSSISMLPGQLCKYAIIKNELHLEVYDHRLRRFCIWYASISQKKLHFYRYKARGVFDSGILDSTFNTTEILFGKVLEWPPASPVSSSKKS